MAGNLRMAQARRFPVRLQILDDSHCSRPDAGASNVPGWAKDEAEEKSLRKAAPGGARTQDAPPGY